MAQADLRDPDFLAGRVLALQADLGTERERSDLVVLALRGQQEELRELRTEVVRQGGVSARTFQIAEALARHLGIDTDNLPPMPDVPIRGSRESDRAIEALERIPTRVDREELERAGPPPAAPAAPSLPITGSWRPQTLRDWAKLLVMLVVALTALAGAAQQIAAALGH